MAVRMEGFWANARIVPARDTTLPVPPELRPPMPAKLPEPYLPNVDRRGRPIPAKPANWTSRHEPKPVRPSPVHHGPGLTVPPKVEGAVLLGGAGLGILLVMAAFGFVMPPLMAGVLIAFASFVGAWAANGAPAESSEAGRRPPRIEIPEHPSLAETALAHAQAAYERGFDGGDLEELEAGIEQALTDPWAYMKRVKPDLAERERQWRAPERNSRADAFSMALEFANAQRPRRIDADVEARREMRRMRAIMETAVDEGRSLTGEERERIERGTARLEQLREQQETLKTVRTWQGMLSVNEQRELAASQRTYWIEFYDGKRRASGRLPFVAQPRTNGTGFDMVGEVSWVANHRCTLDGARVWDAPEGGLLLSEPRLDGPHVLNVKEQFTLTHLNVDIRTAA